MDYQFLNRLNKQQRKAVQHHKGPCMVYAGPGSGKTTVITYRLTHLIQHFKVNPQNILVITFTKASAEEMKQRFEKLNCSSGPQGSSVNFGTFHSIFFRVIRSYAGYDLSSILSEKDKYGLIKNIIKTLGIGQGEDDELIKEIILELGLFYSNYLNRQEFIPNTISSDDFQRLVHYYETFKKDHKKIDFDDMLIKCYQLLKSNPNVLNRLRNQYQYILIDEFQDINKIQFEIVRMMAVPSNNVFVVGDDDQSIYSFRGANPQFILEFDKIYPKAEKVIINVNYRCQQKVIDVANALIKKNEIRVDKDIEAFKGEGKAINYLTPKTRDEEKTEVCLLVQDCVNRGYQYKDIAIIYRTNILANGMVEALLEHQIPFFCKDQVYNIYDHWVSKDVMSYLKSSHNLMDMDSLGRIINKPSRYITKKGMEAAKQYHKDFITSLKVKGDLKAYQIKMLDQLEVDLKTISNLSTAEAIEYIRKEMKYDQYIEDYCMDKKISSNGLFEMLDELEEVSVRYSSHVAFFKHVEEFRNKIKQPKKKEFNSNEVHLLTMHSAKGLEYEVVIIVDAVEEIIPHSKSLEMDGQLEEERRLFYVAITRAKEELYIFSPQFRYDRKADTSRFVSEMQYTGPAKGDLTLGREVFHKIFGRGFIEGLTDKIVKIRFAKNNQVKDFDVSIIMQNNILNNNKA
ncbi:ATP-dependent helicase [Alkaliphilus hydrothermalis]|uniref:DNA 3'-5' helicase n=1 Tax=Alkaliphilus hydrothermalis TaxID=1482730 RepID=A0ABS2NPP4_9FIRM|nr:ATP-dependent helicase [Alkaliphilus hydrothermalis]MBM7614913.1 DNA helicase-2/ATP-dependent DNA helicase PcrA [Alkaliphilus hydrothermalis]